MIMPSHAKNVKRYTEKLPLYARYQVEGYLNGMFNPTVQLPSGGYIVIGITEALVAVDVNSGRATKEGSIEQTATKTNLEAAEEVARQMRLRDLAGLIVIDFIDMDERKNNIAVEKRLKDKLKTDRARIQVGRISGFGLLEMSRQRLRPGMLEATTQMCGHCHGTGLLRSDDNVSLSILRSLEEEGVRGRSKEVLVKAPISIANFLINGKREHIADVEARYGMSVRIECDPTLVSPDFAIEKFRTATRVVAEAPVVVATAAMMDDDDDILLSSTDEEEVEAVAEETEAEDRPRKKRRRRRRRGRGGNGGENAQEGAEQQQAEGEDPAATADAEAPAEATEEPPAEKPKRTRSRSRKKPEAADAPTDAEQVADAPSDDGPADEAPAEKPKRARRSRKKVEEAPAEEAVADAPAAEADAPEAEEKPKPKRKSRAKPKAEAAPAVEPEVAAEAPVEAPVLEAAAPEVKAAEPTPEPEPAKADKPKRKGWWSLGR